MTTRKEIGKIKHIEFGFGGYQNVQIGVSVILGSRDWSVSDFKGCWANDRSDNSKWSENDRLTSLGMTVMYIRDLLQDANVSKLEQLKDKPVEVTFVGNKVETWRLLTEAM